MIAILFFGGLFLLAGLFLLHRLSKRDDQKIFDGPGRWAVSGVLVAWVVLCTRAAAGGGVFGAILVLVAVIPALVILCVLWIPVFVERGLSGLTGAMTGGKEQVEAKPYYFRSRAFRRKGDIDKALLEIESQLLLFPSDWEGHLLRSQIRIEEQKQPTVALAELAEFEAQADLDPGVRNLSRFRRVEILLRNLGDSPAAKEVLEEIRAAAPESESARIADQHLAHLAEDPMEVGAPRPIPLVRHDSRIGLTKDLGASLMVESDPNLEATRLLEILENHPTDWDARDRLATVYSEKLGRPDLAVLELQQLANQSGFSEKRFAACLNRIADNRLRQTPPDLEGARSALEEIRCRFPEGAAATQAANRLSILNREVRSHEARAPIKIGQYEQNIGLKRGSADIPDPNPNK